MIFALRPMRFASAATRLYLIRSATRILAKLSGKPFSHASYTLGVRLRPRARVCGRLQRCLKVRETTAAAQVIVDP